MTKRVPYSRIKTVLPDRAKQEEKRLAASQDKFIIRLPEGMRERIKKEAEDAGRSMNAEIVRTLEAAYPAEPDIYEVLDRVHGMIAQAKNTEGVPYRKELVTALDELSERIASGIESKKFRRAGLLADSAWFSAASSRLQRWERAQEHGVDQGDLERELARGLLSSRGDWVRDAIRLFKAGEPTKALRHWRLDKVRFADPDAAYAAMENWLVDYYRENWGELDDPAPWDEFEDDRE